jgi:hypothetical protein
MKLVNMIVVVAVACVLGGCGASLPDAHPATANDASAMGSPLDDKTNCVPADTNKCPDGFTKARVVVADVSRFTWDETLKAWRYMSSDEMVKKYGEAWDTAKAATSSAYDAAVNAYHRYEKDMEEYRKNHPDTK